MWVPKGLEKEGLKTSSESALSASVTYKLLQTPVFRHLEVLSFDVRCIIFDELEPRV